jgi:flagellar biosynthesis protein FlhF
VAAASPSRAVAPYDGLLSEIDQRILALEHAIAGRRGARHRERKPPATGAAAWRRHLRAQDLDPASTAALLRTAGANPSRRELAAAAAALIRCDTGTIGPGRVTVLAGPPGTGKTTAAVKLALLGRAMGHTPRLVSLDTERPLAAEQLGRYARMLGAEFAAPEDIRQAQMLFANFSEHLRDNEYTIVDMPGCGVRNPGLLEQLREFLRVIPGAELHLVLSGCTRTADLLHASEQLAGLNPSRLLFTHMDETSRVGAAIATAAETGLPVSYLSEGPAITDEFHEASAEQLADMLTRPPEPLPISQPLAAGV